MDSYERDPNWLYPIQCPRLEGRPSGYYFYAGTTDDGRQVLLFENGLALFFDAGGNLIGQEKREPPESQPFPQTKDCAGETGPDFLKRFPEFLASEEGRRWTEHYTNERTRIYGSFFYPWLTELRFHPGTIRVKRFGIPGARIGITDLASIDAQGLHDPNSPEFGEGERAEKLQEIKEWLSNGMFVLWFGKDLWLNGDGHIEST
ncbi:MAG: hypothetical protein P4L84_09200 [Isosphaeraceae bacterium]|nr:hypothetical protein [Isosphaeraceae bacterium]